MADLLTSDIYGITNHINDLKKDYFSANEESLMVGTLGYIGSLFANQWQNQIVMTSQYANESIPTKAKFKRNIIAHALSLDSISVTAIPATMDVQVFLIESEVERNLNDNNQFTIDCSQPIYIGDFEFHFDYDIIITKTKIQDGYVYTARYKDIGTNPISDVTNPYLRPPVIVDTEGERSILILASIHQVGINTITKKIISSNSIENKTFSFDFENQLAHFDITVTDGDVSKKLTPVYTGMYDGSIDDYFYYEYLDDKSIRVKFDSNSYLPRINTLIQVNVYTTNGTSAIFKYNDNVKLNMKSTIYGYSNMTCILRPATESTYGAYDSKSVDELKKLIPKESLSRGNIATSTDLNNYFDIINTTDSKLYFFKRRHNQFDMLFYSYFIFRDNKGNILPTNTITIELTEDDFSSYVDNNLTLKPGTIIKYDPFAKVGTVISKEDYDNKDENNFYYTSPFNIVVNKDPLRTSYYLNIINNVKLLEFSWVNQESEVQFICSNLSWNREYSEDEDIRNTYELSLSMTQNIRADKGIITKDSETEQITAKNIRVFAVFYNSSETPYRYRELDLVDYDDKEFIYQFNAKFTTEDILTKNDRLTVWNMSDINNENADTNYGDFIQNPKVEIYIAINYNNTSYGLNELVGIVPNIENWTVSNKYTTIDNIEFFYNYSDIVSSTATVRQDGEGKTVYKISQVPMLRYSYLKDIDNFYEFLDQMEIRRKYIDGCLDRLEGAMGIDFKFYNTYGPSETYFITDTAHIDKVNMTIKFRTKILSGADKYIRDYIIQDVKSYIENIEEIGNIHMPNITTLIERKYEGQIQYFQFVSINNYDTSIQHILKLDELDYEDEFHVPELLNIDVDENNNPKIELIVDI